MPRISCNASDHASAQDIGLILSLSLRLHPRVVLFEWFCFESSGVTLHTALGTG